MLQVVEQLLARGADGNAMNEDRQTPLHYAALCEHQGVSSVAVQQANGSRTVRYCGTRRLRVPTLTSFFNAGVLGAAAHGCRPCIAGQ